MNKLSKRIKNHDMFGHKIEFNYNKRGSSHQTIIGGICSLIIKIMILAYSFILMKKLIN